MPLRPRHMPSRGARKIVAVSTIEEALGSSAGSPGPMACGEVNGTPARSRLAARPPGQKLDLRRAAADGGDAGIVRSVKADVMLAASFVVAPPPSGIGSPPECHLRRHQPDLRWRG
jgi:hypothetical protein